MCPDIWARCDLEKNMLGWSQCQAHPGMSKIDWHHSALCLSISFLHLFCLPQGFYVFSPFFGGWAKNFNHYQATKKTISLDFHSVSFNFCRAFNNKNRQLSPPAASIHRVKNRHRPCPGVQLLGHLHFRCSTTSDQSLRCGGLCLVRLCLNHQFPRNHIHSYLSLCSML